ncbi:MAG: type I-G CRISPR-associated RAMP protein Csb1/Cas7g [Sulfobacillus sp.]
MDFLEFKRAMHDAVAFEFTAKLQAAGGTNHKVFPPTYLNDDPSTKAKIKARYARETRIMDGAPVPTILLDSIPSQANRMEQALLSAIRDDQTDFTLPVFSVTIPEHGTVTSVDAPHRALDVIFLDSDIEGTSLLNTDFGKKLANAVPANATALYQYAPTALVFGMWNSHSGKAGGRFARIVASEIIGWGNIVEGIKTSSRIDPLEIGNKSELYKVEGTERWVFEKPKGAKKAVSPATVGHGNIPPTINEATGGVSLDHIQQQTTISILALQALHFPDDSGTVAKDRDEAGRAVLAALALVAANLQFSQGYQLRSGCLLQALASPVWKVLGRIAADDREFALTLEESVAIFQQAVTAGADFGLAWGADMPTLMPSAKLMKLVQESDTHRIFDLEPDQASGQEG